MMNGCLSLIIVLSYIPLYLFSFFLFVLFCFVFVFALTTKKKNESKTYLQFRRKRCVVSIGRISSSHRYNHERTHMRSIVYCLSIPYDNASHICFLLYFLSILFYHKFTFFYVFIIWYNVSFVDLQILGLFYFLSSFFFPYT